ncbi:MAG TPA: AzlD domain-containing protein [Negativicutes bacterium]|nr:AzlD domain-containing protein [Negativicutes bacterium]
MNTELLLIIMGMAAATYMTRIGAQLLFARTGMPEWLERWMKHVPTAFLTALIVPAVLMPKGCLDISSGNSYLFAGIVSVVAAWKTGNVLITILLGMTVMVTAKLLFPL